MRKILLGLLAFVILVGGLTMAPFATQSASAIPSTCAAAGIACIDISISVAAPGGGGGTGIGSGGSGGGSSGGGGTVSPPSSTFYRYVSCASQPLIYCYNPDGGTFGYSSSAPYGDNYPGAYAYWNCRGPGVWFGVTFTYERGIFSSYSCSFSAEPVNKNTVLDTKTCYTSYDASLYQSQSKSAIAGGGSLVGGRAAPNPRLNQPNPAHSANITPANFGACGSISANPVFNLNTDKSSLSYYKILLSIKGKQCTLLGLPRFLNDTSKDRIECGAVSVRGSAATYAVNSCKYNFVKVGSSASALPSNVDFSPSACTNFVCNVPSTKIAGTTQPVQLIRNGTNVPILFGKLTVSHDSGVRNINNVQRYTSVVAGSSPMNGTNVNASNQYFQYRDANSNKINFNTWENNATANRNIAFFWASEQGKTFQLTSKYKFSGEFKVLTATNTNGGSSFTFMPDTVECGKSLSNKATISRSVNG